MLRILNLGKNNFKNKGWNFDKGETKQFPAFWVANHSIDEEGKVFSKETFASIGKSVAKTFANRGFDYSKLKIVLTKSGSPIVALKSKNDNNKNTYALISFNAADNERLMGIEMDEKIDVYFYGVFRKGLDRKQFIAIVNVKNNPEATIKFIVEDQKRKKQFVHTIKPVTEIDTTVKPLREKVVEAAKIEFKLKNADGSEKVVPVKEKPKAPRAKNPKAPFNKRNGKAPAGRNPRAPKKDGKAPVRINDKGQNPGSRYSIIITTSAKFNKAKELRKGAVVCVDAPRKTLKGINSNTRIWVDKEVPKDKVLSVIKQLIGADEKKIKTIQI